MVKWCLADSAVGIEGLRPRAILCSASEPLECGTDDLWQSAEAECLFSVGFVVDTYPFYDGV